MPYYAGALLQNAVSSIAIVIPLFVYEFGLVITALHVGVALTEGRALSVPFVMASNLVAALFLWVVTNGGELRFGAGGATVSLEFWLLLYLLILPSLWAAARSPLEFIVRRRAQNGREGSLSGAP